MDEKMPDRPAGRPGMRGGRADVYGVTTKRQKFYRLNVRVE